MRDVKRQRIQRGIDLPLALIGLGACIWLIARASTGDSAPPIGNWQQELPKMPTGLVSETLAILQKVQGPNPTPQDIAAAEAQAAKVETAGYPAIAQVLRQYAALRKKG
jgi:hypothetical protein